MYTNNDIDYLKYLKGKQKYIFGSGKIGKGYVSKLEGYEVVAFIDNDINKQGKECLGYPVISLDEFIGSNKKNEKNVMIIICTIYEKEIREQLLTESVYNFISGGQIDFGGAAEYYDEKYFEWQKIIGKFGAKKKISYFAPYIKADMTVIEFGSGGGYLLDEISAAHKIGVEINDFAREEAETRNLKCVKYTKELPDECADIVISTGALEHCENPFLELQELRKKLKEGAVCVFHVPNESCDSEYAKSNINNHLYTWNCLNIGNLFKAAGFFVHSVERIVSEWPEHYECIDKEVSAEFFDDICKIKGAAKQTSSCLIVAYK